PVRRGLHVQAHIWELGCERGRDQHRVLIRIREELLGESIFVVSAVDLEGRDAGRKPGDAVLAVAGVINRWRTSRGGEEAQLVERYPVDGRKKDFAEVAIDEGVPELAPRTGRRSERHLAARTPHRGRAWTTWSLHRGVSMEEAHGG